MAEYYTPRIEEFRFGFEYEVKLTKHTASTVTEKVWEKCKFGTRSKGENILKGEAIKNNKCFIDNLSPIISSGYIRTKYLDKEDIERLGFKHIGNAVDIWYELEGRFDIGNWTSYKIQIHYGRTDHRMFINAIDCGDEHKIFEGYVKNKSELKFLLKQLGIENDT